MNNKNTESQSESTQNLKSLVCVTCTSCQLICHVFLTYNGHHHDTKHYTNKCELNWFIGHLKLKWNIVKRQYIFTVQTRCMIWMIYPCICLFY